MPLVNHSQDINASSSSSFSLVANQPHDESGTHFTLGQPHDLHALASVDSDAANYLDMLHSQHTSPWGAEVYAGGGGAAADADQKEKRAPPPLLTAAGKAGEQWIFLHKGL